MKTINALIFSAAVLAAVSCESYAPAGHGGLPDIFPDYKGVTVPEGMAALTFRMADGQKCKYTCERKGDTLWYTVRGYDAFPVYISHDPIDRYIAYRLIEPGYESWHDMGIYQRDLCSYKEKAIVTNADNNRGCVNCHTFPGGDPERMLFHARGEGGGTVLIDGDDVRILNLATVGPKKQGTYPAWHPGGRYVAFSSNATRQCFYATARQPIDVYDNYSDIILMDLQTDSISTFAPLCTESVLETFPTWSPDGNKLYYCAADRPQHLPYDLGELHYRLMSVDFADGQFKGEPQTVLDIDSLTISFPRVHDGMMVFTASAFGTFPIWHPEADLWALDLSSGEARRLDEIDSPDTESYHSWSSNGKWMIFSSRRLDGRYTRLFITHLGEDGKFSKPFLLPQRDPDHNQLRLKSYNIPEFIKGEVPDRRKSIKALFK